MGIVFIVRAKAWRENPSLWLNEPVTMSQSTADCCRVGNV